MPNNSPPDKRNSRIRRLQRPTGPAAAGAILKAADGALPQVMQQVARHAAWHEWLAAHLPPPFAEKLSGVVERDGCLTLLACSAAWGTRLRYALRELTPLIKAHAPQVTQIRVRVSPRS